MVAFEGAARLGFRYIETDVHATSDGVLLAFHDPILDRLTDQRGRIDRLEWSSLQHVRVAGTEPIARLEEIFGEFPDLRVNIEPKSDVAVGLLINAIRRTGAEPRVCVGSFSDRRLRQFRAGLPKVCTSMGRAETAGARLYSIGIPLRPGGAVCAQVPVRWKGIRIVDHRFIRAMKQRGLQTHVWTINDPGEMHRLIDLGVDGLMTDRPAQLKTVLIARGQWHQVG